MAKSKKDVSAAGAGKSGKTPGPVPASSAPPVSKNTPMPKAQPAKPTAGASAFATAGMTPAMVPNPPVPSARPAASAPAPVAPAKAKAPAAAPVTKDQVARRAYEIWVAKGRPAGLDLENWQQAERELGYKGGR